MHSRRGFLATNLRALPLISLAPSIPGFLARTARAAEPARDGRILVVVQLDGGNDGINTVVPFGDEGYAKHRRVLRLPASGLIEVADGVGLHPAMRAAGALLDSGRLAIVRGVGYPNPSRSHFASMATWHTARLDPEEHQGAGWLGRGLGDRAGPGTRAVFLGAGTPPAALRGRRSSAVTLERLEDFAVDPATAARGDRPGPGEGDGLAAFARRSALDAYATADRMAALARADTSGLYPRTGLADRLGLVSRLIKADLGARVYYTSQAGYDTHAAQIATHGALLGELSGALRAFLDDLAASGLGDRVLVLAFSEFGRRVAENGSAGTDHGTAGPVFVAGPAVRAGLIGSQPGLLDLEAGDLKVAVDFRRIYATLLEGWLGLPSREALAGDYEPLPLLLEPFSLGRGGLVGRA